MERTHRQPVFLERNDGLLLLLLLLLLLQMLTTEPPLSVYVAARYGY